MTVKQAIIGATLFGAGVLASNYVRHAAASLVNKDPLPYVTVSYEKLGTFVNGERVDTLGRIGEPRCDWRELPIRSRELLTLDGMKENPKLIADYVGIKLGIKNDSIIPDMIQRQ